MRGRENTMDSMGSSKLFTEVATVMLETFLDLEIRFMVLLRIVSSLSTFKTLPGNLSELYRACTMTNIYKEEINSIDDFD